MVILSEPVVVAYAVDSTSNPANAAAASAATGALASTSSLGIGIGVGAGAMLVLALVAFLVMRRRGSGSIAAAEARQSPLSMDPTASNQFHPAAVGPKGGAGGSFVLANPMAQVHADHSKSTRGMDASGAVALHATGVSARKPPASNRRLVVPSEDPSVPRGWQAKPDGTFVSPNGNGHAKLPASLAALYHGLGPEWEIDFDAGDAYYINANDGTTYWERPGPASPLHK